MKKRKSRGNGVDNPFSLIELLVVISIISILMALLFSALKSGMDMAKQTACMNNQRQIGFGFTGFIGSHDGSLPPMCMEIISGDTNRDDYDGSTYGTANGMPWPVWDVLIFNDAGRSPKIFGCPGMPQSFRTTRTLTSLDGKKYDGYRSYSVNARGAFSKKQNPLDVVMVYNFGQRVSIMAPDTMIMADSPYFSNRLGQGPGAGLYNEWNLRTSTADGSVAPGTNHPGLRANFLFVDMHVENASVYDSRFILPYKGSWTPTGGD